MGIIYLMIERFINPILLDENFAKQMRFIAGPRQVGKTTLAKKILTLKNCSSLYFNWDDKSIRSKYRNDTNFFLANIEKLKQEKKKPKNFWLCFDEIHKVQKWKNILKAFFDEHQEEIYALITGSARLDLFRKSGDSLTGRYFLFHLLPITLAELSNDQTRHQDFTIDANEFTKKRIYQTVLQNKYDHFENLYRFSGFPEPLSKRNKTFQSLWQREYLETIIYEDLADISQIKDLESVAKLMEILPNSIGSPLSINSLSKVLEINFATIKNYLRYLELTYMVFSLKPYSKKIKRSIKKSSKLYFYDWTRAPEDEGARFENYIACELLSLTKFWQDYGICNADLFFVRTEDGKETDFLITVEKKPWLLIEAKLSSTNIEAHHHRHAKEFGNIPIVQITKNSELIVKENNTYIVPVTKFF